MEVTVIVTWERSHNKIVSLLFHLERSRHLDALIDVVLNTALPCHFMLGKRLLGVMANGTGHPVPARR
jgi:hypothetical protein